MANIRLRQAATEFGVGVETIVSTLEKANLPISHNPNAKLTNEQYELVQKKHQKDKEVKDAASQVDIALPEKKKNAGGESKAEKVQEDLPKAKEESEVAKVKKRSDVKADISEISAEEKEIKAAKKAAERKAVEKKTAEKKVQELKEDELVEVQLQVPVVELPKEVEPTPVVEKVVEIEKVVEEAKQLQTPETPKVSIEAEKKSETVDVQPKVEVKEEEVLKQEQPPVEETPSSTPVEEIKEEKPLEAPIVESDDVSEKAKGPVVVGVIDLNQFKKNKKTAHANLKKESPAVAVEEIQPKVEDAPEKVEVDVEASPVVEAKKEEPTTEFIKTQYTKLEGPKFVDVQKIDLSQFNKKPKLVASSKDLQDSNKKKRKRIKDDKPTNSQSNVKMVSKPELKPGNTGGGAARPTNPWQGKKTGGGKHSKGSKAPVPVDSNEIEKQIKETLARLSPMGKSKFSKHRREKRQNVSSQMEEEQEKLNLEKNTLKVTEFVTVNELATMMDVPVTKIIATCMGIGLFVSINQRLTAEPIALLAEEFGFNVEFVDSEVMDAIVDEADAEEGTEHRTPVVTVMGHVDHGKTSLLDYIRNANVIAGEAGGITQHIGAYEVLLENGKTITFLDTPGHEAFTAMRARGAKITDIAIIVISADDRIMPQTIEAINHAQAAGVPIVFAINKIDKEGANPDQIKTELANMNLLVEEWGGKYQSQDISAKKGLNIDALLEKVLLEAEMLDLKCNPNKRAKGTVIESSLDKGRGFVAKILIQDGTVKIGDSILAGSTYGKVKAMYNERNQPVKQVGPAAPVLMLGLNGAPQAGDLFNVTATEKDAKDAAARRLQFQREQGLRTQKHITLDEIGRRIAIGDFKELNVIVKGDVDGSIEALSDSLLKLSTPEVQVNVIHKSVGQISESDILLASASEAIVLGFQVRPSMSARKLAETEQIDIRLYSIIYDAINEIKDAIEGMLSPEIQERIVSNIEVREIFKIGKVGTIAGCMVLDGKINRQTKIRLIRDGIVVYTGKLGSLKRFKDDVKEVVSGQDCGLNIENFNDVKVGDIVEGYETSEVKRTL